MRNLILENKEEGLPKHLEIKTARTLHEKKVPIKDIAKAIKSTQAYARDILINEGLMTPRLGTMIQWKTKEDHIYNQLVQDFTYGQIAERMGVSNPQNKAQGMGSYIKKKWGSKEDFLKNFKPKHQKIAAEKKEEIDKEKLKKEKEGIKKVIALNALIKLDHPEIYAESEKRLDAIYEILK
jgi:hypothetical protein